MTVRLPPRKLAHPAPGQPEYTGDSYRGIRAAQVDGKKWIDLNFLRTADGVVVCTHWAKVLRHGFTDPQGLLNRNVDVADLTWVQIQRLTTGPEHGAYRIHRAEDILPYALSRNLNVEFEAKCDFSVADFKKVRRMVSDPSRVQVKVGAWIKPRPWVILEHAHDAGFTTIILNHAPAPPRVAFPASAEPFIDYYRGHKPRYV